MWFEILPAIGIMFSAMTLGMYGTQLVPWLFLNGHRSFKELKNCNQISNFYRDERLEGLTRIGKGPYWPKGLEAIPDEPPQNSSSTS